MFVRDSIALCLVFVIEVTTVMCFYVLKCCERYVAWLNTILVIFLEAAATFLSGCYTAGMSPAFFVREVRSGKKSCGMSRCQGTGRCGSVTRKCFFKV